MRSAIRVAGMGACLLAVLTTCDLFDAGLGAKVDITPPVTKILSPAPNSYINAPSLVLSGTAVDDLGITSLTARVRNQSGATVKEASTLPASDGTWSLSFDTRARGSATHDYLPDGEYSIEVLTQDGRDRTHTTYTTVFVDTRPPTVLVTSPLTKSDDSGGSGYSASHYTDAVDIKGEVFDYSPVSQVWVTITDDAGNEVLGGRKLADGTNTWTVRFDLAGKGLADAETYRIKAEVLDLAGNRSTYFFHRQDILFLKIPEKPFPSMAEIGRVDQDGLLGSSGLAPEGLAGRRIDLDQSAQFPDFVFDAAPTLNFEFINIDPSKGAEENLVSPKSRISGSIIPPLSGGAVMPNTLRIVVKDRDGAGAAAATIQHGDPRLKLQSIGSAMSYSFELKDDGGADLTPAAYRFTVYAETDVNIKKESDSFEFFVDSEAPYLEISSPTALYLKDSFSIRFNASHAAGLQKLTVEEKYKDGAFALHHEVVLSGTQATNQETDLIAISPSGNGLYNYRLTLLTQGGKTATAYLAVYHDTTAPALTVQTPASGAIVEDTLTMSGIVSDGDGSGSVQLRYSVDGGGSWASYSPGGINWTRTGIALGTEGAKELRVYAEDALGNAGPEQAIPFFHDTGLPSLSGINIPAGSTAYRTATYVLSGNAADSSGLASLSIERSKNGGAYAHAAGSPFALSGISAPWTYTHTVDAAGADDGEYVYRISAFDSSGRSRIESRTVRVDTQSPSTLIQSPGPFVAGNSVSFTGTASDGSGSGVKLVEYRLNGGPWQSAAGSANWIASVDLSAMLEGTHTIEARATDYADLVSAAPDSRTFLLDQSAPTTTATDPAGASGLFSLGGTASDPNGIQSLSITQQKDGGAGTAVPVSLGPDLPNRTWTAANLPAGGVDTGVFTYTIVPTDKAGRTGTPVIRTVVMDFDPPAVGAVSDPAADGALIFGSTYTIRGSAADIGPSGLKRVEYSLDGGASWSAAAGTGGWSIVVDLATLGEGARSVTLRAVDNADNVTLPGSYAVRTFTVDQNPPALAETGIGTTSTVYRGAAFTLSGTHSDSNGVQSLTVTQRLNGGAAVTVYSNGTWASPTAEGTAWSAAGLPRDPDNPAATLLAEGLYEYTVTAVDKAGRSASLYRAVRVDTSPPELVVSKVRYGAVERFVDPADTEAVLVESGAVTILGSSGDGQGSGMDSLAYSLNGTDYTPIAFSGTNWSFPLDFGAAQGLKSIWVRARDKLGFESLAGPVSLMYDGAPPTLSETIVGAPSQVYRTASYDLRFISADGNGLNTLTIERSTDGGTTYLPLETVDLSGATSSDLTRSYAVNAGTHADDGAYLYRITAEDVAGRRTSIVRSVFVDTLEPSAAVQDPGPFLSGNSGTLFGTASDGAGSGLSWVRYSTDNANWTPTIGTENWLVTLDLDTDGAGPDTGLAEGSHTLYIRTEDRAGNAGAALSRSFVVDQAPPALTLYKADGSDFVDETFYKSSSVSLSGTAADSNGVQSVVLTQTKGAGAPVALAVTLGAGTNSRSWTAVAPLDEGEGTYTIVATITDAAGRTAAVSRTIIKDTQAPNLPAVTSPASAGQWVSGASYLFSGSASDVGTAGIAAVYLGSGARGLTPPEDVGDPFWAQASGSSSWNGSLVLSGEGERALYLKARDRAGNLSLTASFDYGIDQSNPTLAVADPPAHISGSFTLSGSADDTNGVSSVTVAERRPGQGSFDAPQAAAYNPATKAWSFLRTFPAVPDGALPDGAYQYQVTVTDLAGKTAVSSKTVTLDRTAPTLNLNQPSPYIFSAGVLYGNGVLTLSGTAGDAGNLSGLELRIGEGAWTSFGASPYTSFSFPLDTASQADKADLTVSVRATDMAGNSSTESWIIRVDQDTDKPAVSVTSPAEGAAVGNLISVSGTASDDDGLSAAADTVQYQYSDDGGGTWTAWADAATAALSAVSRSYTFDFTPASDGAKQFRVRARDINGVYSNIFQRTVQRDTGAPVIAFLTPTPASGGVRNGDFTVAGTASDSSGTVSTVTYRVIVDGVQIVPATGMISSGGGTDTASFSASISTAAGTGTYQVIIRTVDDSGNAREETLQVVVDKTPPVPAFSAPVPDSLRNNRISLGGTASDNLGLASVGVSVVKGGAVVGSPIAATGTYNWSIADFDTAFYGNDTYGTFVSGSRYSLTLRVSATDTAGNVGVADLTFFIDQESDKPVVGFTTASAPAYIGTYQIVGAAEDDDGISEIAVSTNGGASYTVLAPPGGGWTKNSTWSYTLPSADGAAALRVRVRDTSSPYIETISPATTFNIDTENPDVAFTAPTANAVLKADQLIFSGTFADESGVTTIKLKADSADFGSGDVKTVSITAGVSGSWSYAFPAADLGDGLRTIYLQAVDASGRSSTVNRTVTVDKTAPTVLVAEPASGSAAFGLTRIRGDASDAVSSLRSVKIGLGKTINTSDWDHPSNVWYPASGTVSWSYTITNINSFANTTYAVDLGDTNGNGVVDGGETWQNIWRLNIYVRAEDAAGTGPLGNVSVVDTYYLEVDPLRDRPEIMVLQPVDYDSVVGGFLRIVGSSYDTNYIAKNQIAFDLNDNGLFNDPGDIWPSAAGFTPPAVDGTDAATTAWYAMSGTTSWSQVINGKGEFNPSGAATTRPIRFKVRAVDSKIAHGGTPDVAGLPAVYRVVFSNAVPQFSTLSLATGDTVGGSDVRLTGYVKVPSEVGMNQIYFRHEGPRISSTDLIGGAAGMRAVLLNPGDDGYEALYDTYALDIAIDTTAADLFQNNAGTMTVALWAEDTKFFRSIQTISLNVDNRAPTDLAYTGYTEIIGSQAEIQGSVKDTGVVSGIRRVVFYLQRGSDALRLKGGSGALPNGADQVLDLEDPVYDDYRIVIDNRLEDGNDAGSAGDGDGFREWLTISSGAYLWAAQFDSNLVADGKVSIRYRAEDFAGNTVSGSSDGYVANNKPLIQSIRLGTDLNGADGITEDERADPISSGYSATGFTARNNLLLILINAVGGNGTKRYSVTHNGMELNGNALNGNDMTNNAVLIDTSLLPDSLAPDDTGFVVKVYDSTTSDDGDDTDELSATVTVNLTVDNIDETPPQVRFLQLDAADVAFSGTTKLGHIDPWDQSSWNDVEPGFSKANEILGNDADISGTVVLRGRVSDNQRISRLWLGIDLNGDGDFADTVGGIAERQQVAAPGAGNLLVPSANTLGTVSFANQTLSIADGHTADFAFQWNSSMVQGTARSNVALQAEAFDARAVADGGPNPSTVAPLRSAGSGANTTEFNTFQVDVVPYITAVVRNPTYNTHRSRSGAFSLLRGEAGNKLVGFNLNTGGSFVVSQNRDGTGSPVAVTGYGVNGSFTELSFQVPAAARSGWLHLTVNGVEAVNNRNSNLQSFNKEDNPSLSETAYWTDDRYLRIWQSNAADFFAGSDTPIYPAMSMDSAGALYASFSNYSTASVYYSTIGGTAQQVFYTFDPPEETEIVVTGTGGTRQVNVLYSANYHGGNVANWNSGSEDAGGLYLYDDSAELRSYGRDDRSAYRFELFYHNQMLQQFKNLRIARAAVGAGERIHAVYYDRITSAIKYTNINDGYNIPGAAGTETTHELSWVKIDGDADGDDTATYSDGTSLVLGAARFEGGLSPSTGTGEMSALALTSNKYPVVVYFDAVNNTLKLARANNGNPKTSENQWSVQGVLNPVDGNAGTIADYLSAKIDSSGYLHIAFQNSRGELVYVKSTNNPADGATAYTFGASQIIASSAIWIDLTLYGSTPYISYLTRINSFDGMNMAFWDDSLDLNQDGTAEGGWETMAAAMNYKTGSLRTSIEAYPGASGPWTAAVGFSPGNLYRVVYYIGR